MFTKRLGLREAQNSLESKISDSIPVGELRSFSKIILEKLSGIPAVEWYMRKDIFLNQEQIAELDNIILRIKTGEPLQYILGECWFMDFKFGVNPSVLIPRPETEELCGYILKDIKELGIQNVVEIGTGSGCISLSLALSHPGLKIYASDISPEALDTAQRNAIELGADVKFIRHDILRDQAELLPEAGLWVSNPPYIPGDEIRNMSRNVTAFEPHTALFTPSGDALLFYRTIGKTAFRRLFPGGVLWFEIHEDMSAGVQEILKETGFTDISAREDYKGKYRFVRARKK